jgi:hypothetical protein
MIFNSVHDAAVAYWERGFTPLPMVRGQKKPMDCEWQYTTRAAMDIEHRFSSGAGPLNIALMTGPGGGDFAEVDIDGKDVAPRIRPLLPATGITWGRPGNPESHYGYVSPNCLSDEFVDPVLTETAKRIIDRARPKLDAMAPAERSEEVKTRLRREAAEAMRSEVFGVWVSALDLYLAGCKRMLVELHAGRPPIKSGEPPPDASLDELKNYLPRGDIATAPPSLHPSGETYTWARFSEPAHIAPAALRSAVGKAAVAGLMGGICS